MKELESRLEQITLGACDQRLRTFAHIRDAQQWRFHNEPTKTILARSFQEIAASDAVLLDLTTHVTPAKRTGLSIEAGYAAALRKPILALWHSPDRPNMTTDLADCEVSYSDVSEIRGKVAEMLCLVFDPLSGDSQH
jgi:nucleoside 2-deoxyribosyltransferase